MRLLLFIVGVGAGNTTRTLSILDELMRQEPALDVQVAAQGKALELLRERDVCPVHPLREISYSSGGAFSGWNIVRSNLSFPLKFMQNRGEARRLMRRLEPDLVVADSDFYCLGPARRLGLPLATVNSSPAVVALFERHGIVPGGWFSARIIERTDCWLQRHYADRVVCPVLRPLDGLEEKIHQIPPIVRPEFNATPGATDGEPSEEVVVVTGGSGIGVDEIDLRGLKEPMTTFGSQVAGAPEHADQRGFDLNHVEAMRRAKVLVVQGGFSSVSEAVALRRPTVVVPIGRHAEQYVNAKEVEAMGLGLAAAGAEAGEKVHEILRDYDAFAARCAAHSFATDGARHAAASLLEMLRGGRSDD